MLRNIVLVTLLMLLAAGLSFSAGEAEEDVREVTFMLDWVPNVNHVGIFVAQDQGYFAEAGLDVQIVQPGEVSAEAAVAGERADFGVGFQENLTLLRAEGVPLVSIAAMIQTNTSGFAVREGEGIETPADFEDLSYGTFQSPFEEPTLSSLVRCAGGDPSTIEFVPAGTELLAMLQQEQADIVWIYYGTQGFQAERVGIDITYFPLNEYSDCIPDYYTPLIIASESTLAEEPELARDFLGALSRGHRFVIENPTESARILKAAVPELNQEQLLDSVPWLSERLVMDAPEWGYQEEAIWGDYADWMREVGVLDKEFDPSSAYSNDYLPGETGR
jgi:ABC-type nitrate/sulfonate/bicarbonate transport system substrate-binding protein